MPLLQGLDVYRKEGLKVSVCAKPEDTSMLNDRMSNSFRVIVGEPYYY